ncbi:MAG: DUF397 domain-containing protein [Actinomycetota bacterium]|nr:DUF397 domain-containing protein [Actinomycetota bacterium]
MTNQSGGQALRSARYRKSRRSSGAQACVAIGHAAGWTGMQDTTEHPDSRQRTTLAVPTPQFAVFLTAVNRGQLNP